MHNIMLVDMIDTLQDLTNAMTTEWERGQTERKKVSLLLCYENLGNILHVNLVVIKQKEFENKKLAFFTIQLTK